MTREDAIQTIETLYPADSQFPEVAENGRQLLAQAEEIAGMDWRDASDKVIFTYASLCLEKESGCV